MKTPFENENNSQGTIIIFTLYYPFRDYDIYFDPIIRLFSKKFNRVFIISSCKDSKKIISLPENVSAKGIVQTQSFREKIFSIKNIFNKDLYIELYHLIFIYKRFPKLFFWKYALNAFVTADFYKKQLKKIISEEGIDANSLYVYSTWMLPQLYGAIQLKRKNPRIKIFCHAHSADIYFNRDVNNYLPFKRIIYKNINNVFFISDHGKKYFIDKIKVEKENNSKASINRLGILNSFARTGTTNKEKIVIVSNGWIIPLKRIDLIASSLVLIKDISIEWVHIGDCNSTREKFEEFKNYIKQVFVNNQNISFRFLGRISNSEVFEFYKNNVVDLFINVSVSEGVPVSIMEAMSFGTPVIATAVGGTPEIVNNTNGFLLSPNPTINEIKAIISSFHLLPEERKLNYRSEAYKTWQTKYNADVNSKEVIEVILPSQSETQNEFKNILLTFDYELKLGERSGTPLTCLINPTKQILVILKKYKNKAVFFIDTVYLIRLEELSKTNVNAKNDLESIYHQIRNIYNDGHYVYLHIHPHWLDAKYMEEKNEWDLTDLSKFSFHNLSTTLQHFVFENSVKILKSIISPINPTYYPEGFRAGGLYVQPFSDFASYFNKHSIKYDFSVLKGYYSNEDSYSFNFINTPQKNIYKFSDNIIIENQEGEFTEFCLTNLELKNAIKIINSIYYRIIRNFPVSKRFNAGTGSKNKILSVKKHTIFLSNETSSFEMINDIKIRIYIHFLKKNNYLQFITHPKLLSNYSLNCFDRFLKKANNQFHIISDFKKFNY